MPRSAAVAASSDANQRWSRREPSSRFRAQLSVPSPAWIRLTFSSRSLTEGRGVLRETEIETIFVCFLPTL